MDFMNMHLQFRPATKRPIKYRLVDSYTALKPRTYFIATKPFKLVTIIHGKEETKKQVQTGDFVLCGPFDERYAISPHKLIGIYNIIDGVLTPRPKQVMVAKVTAAHFRKHGWDPDNTTFIAPWGEEMRLEPGDFLVQQDKKRGHYYRISQEAFRKTYQLV